MKKRILLIGGNYFPEPTGIGKYNGEMIKWLAENGHDCTIVTTFPYYPQWKIQDPYVKSSFWFKSEILNIPNARPVKVIRCPHFVPKNPTALSRSISDFSYFFSAYLAILALLFYRKFDNIITVAPPFTVGLLGIFYKKLRGGKLLYHIQDLQVDAARDLKMINSNTILKIFFSIERFIIHQSDCVSTISHGMIEKVKLKCKKEVMLFPNWVDIDAFYPMTDKAALKEEYGFKPTDKVVLYAGAIGHKQGLEAILHSAKILEGNPDIKFAICGSGPYKEQLVNLKDQMNLQNVLFLPLQPLNVFNSFLNMADAHLVIQKAGASDLVLPSKLSAILSVGGLAIVTASEGTSLYNIMSSTNMGIVIEPENQDELVAAISSVANGNFNDKSKKAREYAEQYLCRNRILSNCFTEVLGSKRHRAAAMPARQEIMSRGIESLS